ncbi:MAG: hypothetical protein ICV54_15185 [Nostoc sp. C3-bin3]|nr:hypothetical protein [Nostoc sp. C3-bin3]
MSQVGIKTKITAVPRFTQKLQELKALGFQIKLVLADSLYGESGDVIGVLTKLNLQFIVAIRSNHPVGYFQVSEYATTVGGFISRSFLTTKPSND